MGYRSWKVLCRTFHKDALGESDKASVAVPVSAAGQIAELSVSPASISFWRVPDCRHADGHVHGAHNGPPGSMAAVTLDGSALPGYTGLSQTRFLLQSGETQTVTVTMDPSSLPPTKS